MKKFLLLVIGILFLTSCGSPPSEKNISHDVPTITHDSITRVENMEQKYGSESVAPEASDRNDSFCQKEHCVFPQEKLSELNLVGTMTGKNLQWAFLENSAGTTQKIEVGQWLSEKHEKVVSIRSEVLELIKQDGQKIVLGFKEG